MDRRMFVKNFGIISTLPIINPFGVQTVIDTLSDTFDSSNNYLPNIVFTISDSKFYLRQVDVDLREKYRALVVKELIKYPEKIRRNIHKICLADIVYYKDKEILLGATYIGPTILLSTRNELGISSELHHEISHILLQRYERRFNKTAWLELNPTEFQYTDETNKGIEAIRQKRTSTEYNSTLCSQGFLNLYSQTTLANDIGEIATLMMGDSEHYSTVLKSSSKISKKVDILRDFYKSIDSNFNVL